jgi:hypothetical protein
MKALVFEEHASVLPHWAAQGLHDAAVVVLDAHLDLKYVDDARIGRLRCCGDVDALRVLESPHPFAVAPDAGFGIEDFLYPAAGLGLVGGVVWVAPPFALRRGFGPALEGLVKMEGVSLSDIESLDVTPGAWIEGRLMGIPLAACTLEQLRLFPLPAGWQIDIDVDDFVELPGDRVWPDPVATQLQLRTLPNCPVLLTISLSVGSGFTPLRRRHLGELLAAAWIGPPARMPSPGVSRLTSGHAAGPPPPRTWRSRSPPRRAAGCRWTPRGCAMGSVPSGHSTCPWRPHGSGRRR